MAETKNPIDCLFDETNNDAIVLFSEKGEEIAFEQVALIPIKSKTYAILKPLKPMEGVGENEGLVFSIEVSKEDGQEYLALVTEDTVIDEVFAIYDKLVDEEEEAEKEEQAKKEDNKDSDAK